MTDYTYRDRNVCPNCHTISGLKRPSISNKFWECMRCEWTGKTPLKAVVPHRNGVAIPSLLGVV